MNDVLIRVNEQGIIQKKYFDGLDLMKKNTYSMYSLLNKELNTQIMNMIEDDQSDMYLAGINLHGKEVDVLVIRKTNDLLFYAIEQPLDVCQRGMVFHFLHAIFAEDITSMHNQDANSRHYFELIQKLNNELINKSRQIEKMNIELTRANALLNDRLVKDPLTKLVSRYQYRDDIASMISKKPKSKGLFAFIDIDDFKKINDQHSHKIGDSYLIEFAHRLKQIPFDSSVVMRIAGDEFGIFLYDLTSLHDSVERLWTFFTSQILKPIKIDKLELPLSISLGVAFFPSDADDIHLLIDYADFAMYQAKKEGKNCYAVFSKEAFTKEIES